MGKPRRAWAYSGLQRRPRCPSRCRGGPEAGACTGSGHGMNHEPLEMYISRGSACIHCPSRFGLRLSRPGFRALSRPGEQGYFPEPAREPASALQPARLRACVEQRYGMHESAELRTLCLSKQIQASIQETRQPGIPRINHRQYFPCPPRGKLHERARIVLADFVSV